MELRKSHFPYCLQQIDGGRYIVLNRKYKPLGETADAWVSYETHPTVFPLKITAATAKTLSWEQSDATDRIYLYSDKCIPTSSATHMTAYLDRLAILMKIKSSAED